MPYATPQAIAPPGYSVATNWWVSTPVPICGLPGPTVAKDYRYRSFWRPPKAVAALCCPQALSCRATRLRAWQRIARPSPGRAKAIARPARSVRRRALPPGQSSGTAASRNQLRCQRRRYSAASCAWWRLIADCCCPKLSRSGWGLPAARILRRQRQRRPPPRMELAHALLRMKGLAAIAETHLCHGYPRLTGLLSRCASLVPDCFTAVTALRHREGAGEPVNPSSGRVDSRFTLFRTPAS